MEQELTSAITWDFLENLTEGIVVADKKGTIHYLNAAAKMLLGVQQRPTSLEQVYQVVAPDKDWQVLLNPPVERYLHTDRGSIEICAKSYREHNVDLIQILINPIQPSPIERELAALEQLTALTRISNEPNFDKKLQLIVDGLRMTGWDRVVLSLRDKHFHPTEIITAGFATEERQYLIENMLPPEVWIEFFNDKTHQKYRRGSCYFVPGDSSWAQEIAGKILPDDKAPATDADAWHPNDLMCVPLYDRQRQRIGLIGLDQPRSGRRPDKRAIQTIELFAQFAASVIENAQLVNETLTRSWELELLAKASESFSGTLEKESVLRLMGEHMLQAVHAHGYTIYRWQEESNSLIVLEDHTLASQGETLPAGTSFELNGVNSIQQVLTTQKPLIVQTGGNDLQPLRRPSWLAENETFTSAIVPLVLSGVTYGVIEIFTRDNGQNIGADELQLLAALSNQGGKALETALIFEDTYERERFYNALGSVSLAINFTLDLQTVLNLICRESLRIFNVDGAYIWEREGDHFVVSAAQGHGEKDSIGSAIPVTSTDSLLSQIVKSGQATYVNHVQGTTDISLQLPSKEAIQAALGVPLEQEGEIVGVLILVEKTNPDRFTEKDITQASMFGVQAAIALQNARLFEELRQFNEKLDLRVAERTRALNEESTRVKILLRITSELSASLDQDRVLNRALQLVNEVVNATQGVILLIDQESGELIFRAAFGTEHGTISYPGVPSGLMQDEGLAGWMIENRSSVIVHDTREDPRWIKRETSRNLRSVLAVPLITNEEVIGVLMLFHTRPNAFTMQQLDLVEAAAIQVSNAINNANLYLLIRDQAERLGAMLRLEQIEAAKNQAIVESIADGVLVADATGNIKLVNKRTTLILDIPEEELIGRSVNELLGLYSHSGDSWISTIKDWAENADRIEQWTVLADRFNIEEKIVSVHLSPVFVNKQFYGTVSIFRDITKEVEVDKLKSEFVSTVSHELRTPMTSIKGYADLMLMGAAGEMTQPQHRYLQVIKSNAERLHMLVNDLLDISRLETGKTKLDLRPLDIPQVVEDIIEKHLHGRIQHENKNITVSTALPPSLPLVNADEAGITQILTNLLDNAFNYTPENGRITVKAQAEGNYVHISVSDTGIGISEEDQAKIFDRFFRAEDESVQKIRGTGLGLAIVNSLVEMHGGKLTVDSKPDEGSTFTFNLPIVVENGDDPS